MAVPFGCRALDDLILRFARAGALTCVKEARRHRKLFRGGHPLE